MSNDKVECQCCGKMMVPRVIVSDVAYIQGIPVGRRRAESSVCPFCLSDKWMVTEAAALVEASAAQTASREFIGVVLLAIVNIALFSRYGAQVGGIAVIVSIALFFLRKELAKALKQRLTRVFRN